PSLRVPREDGAEPAEVDDDSARGERGVAVAAARAAERGRTALPAGRIERLLDRLPRVRPVHDRLARERAAPGGEALDVAGAGAGGGPIHRGRGRELHTTFHRTHQILNLARSREGMARTTRLTQRQRSGM